MIFKWPFSFLLTLVHDFSLAILIGYQIGLCHSLKLYFFAWPVTTHKSGKKK